MFCKMGRIGNVNSVPPQARRFTLMTWIVCFLNNFWKEIFKLPRPPKRLHVNAAESEVSKHTVVQPGFPSTHSAHVSCDGAIFFILDPSPLPGLSSPRPLLFFLPVLSSSSSHSLSAPGLAKYMLTYTILPMAPSVLLRDGYQKRR